MLRWKRKSLRLFCLFCSILAPYQALARGPSKFPPWNWEIGGCFKSVLSHHGLRQSNVFPRSESWVSEQRLRLTAEASRAWFRVETAGELSLFYRTANDPLYPIAQPSAAWNASAKPVDSPTTQLLARLDRALVQLRGGGITATAGKQVVVMGVGRIFSAISQVPRLPFVVVDSEFPLTEDAVTVVWDGALALETRWLPRVPGQERDGFHVRAKGNKGGYDVALTAGRSDDKAFIGLETAGNVGDYLFRSELVGYDNKGKGYVQGLLGFDTVLSSVLSADLELFHNGLGDVTHRSSPYRGRWYLGTRWTWNATPLLKAQTVALANLGDPSALFHLLLTYSIGPSMDLSLGHFRSVGSGTAEFGGRLPLAPGLELGMPDLTYVLWKVYF